MKTNRKLSEDEKSLVKRAVAEVGPAETSRIFEIRLPRIVDTLLDGKYQYRMCLDISSIIE